MARLRPSSLPSVSNLSPSEVLHSHLALIDHNLVLRVQMISSSERALGLLLTRSCSPVSFSCKARTSQYMKAVATKVYSTIGADPVMLIRRSISAILLPKFSTSFLGLVREPHFLQGLENRANVKIVDMLILLYNDTEDLRTGGVIKKVFYDSLTYIKHDGRDHSLSAPSKIITVQVAYREKFYISIPNPRSCKSLNPFGDFPIFG